MLCESNNAKIKIKPSENKKWNGRTSCSSRWTERSGSATTDVKNSLLPKYAAETRGTHKGSVNFTEGKCIGF